MAKYSTLKKSKDKSLAADNRRIYIEKTVNEAVSYVNYWTRKELLSILLDETTTTPLCIKINKLEYMIGKFLVKCVNNFWSVQSIFSKTENIFSNRTVAVIYALCECKKYHKLAQEILKHDTDIIRISEELTLYMHLGKSAKIKHDSWRVDHYSIMESSVRYKLEDAKRHLEKSLHLAKYFKI